MRTIRDPIHRDIAVPHVHGAVIDSLVFQRLRYVRQNGLLHFVFPGAVHTRFAHSIGTMANATAAWPYLIAEAEIATAEQRHATEYVKVVFELAALLHDIGHCAFSHSAEDVTIAGKPLFGTFGELCSRWGESAFLASYESAKPGVAQKKADHEHIGLLLVRRLFSTDESLDDVCKASAGASGSQLGQDVLSILKEVIAPSDYFRDCLRTLASCLRSDEPDAHHALRRILSRLVSGTLDVDRMDYLLRDAFYCGVPYGLYERSMLLAGLRVLPVSGALTLCLSAKATLALDDLLWSRHQMFAQVYNHKTNVIMNHMLARALESAMTVGQADLTRPLTFEEYLAFTDDLVMGKVFSNCLRAPEAKNTVFGRTLTRRVVPRYLGSQTPEGNVDLDALRLDVAREHSVAEKDVVAIPAKSEILKVDSELPTLFWRNKSTGDYNFEAFVARSAIVNKVTLVYRRVHFFDVALPSAAS